MSHPTPRPSPGPLADAPVAEPAYAHGSRLAKPVASVVVRVRNEAAALTCLFERLAAQDFEEEWELVVVDNESDDGSDEVATRAGARLYRLPRDRFGYGRATNIGVRLSRGRYVVLLSAHAIPLGDDWLRRMIGAIASDPALASVFCRQVPARPVSRLELMRFLNFLPRSYRVGPDQFSAACHRGDDPYEVARFSASACVVRRDVTLALPFRDLPYAEDRAFAVDCLAAGFALGYVADVSVRYDKPSSVHSAFRVGWRLEVAKRLVREHAAAATGAPRRRDGASALVLSGLAAWPTALARIASILATHSSGRGPAIRAAAVAAARTAGTSFGALSWRLYRGRLAPAPADSGPTD